MVGLEIVNRRPIQAGENIPISARSQKIVLLEGGRCRYRLFITCCAACGAVQTEFLYFHSAGGEAFPSFRINSKMCSASTFL